MGTYATSTSVSDLRTPLLALVSSISHSNANVTTLLQKQATLALNLWADAQLAIINLNASAADSYSNGVGMSVTKKRLEAAMAAAADHYEAFVRACGLGNVTVPTLDNSIALWDMSQSPHES